MAQDQAIGASRGGRSTKIHLVTDLLGRPIAIDLTPGRHCGIRSVKALLAKIGACKRRFADRAYGADALRQRLHGSCIKLVIPGKQTRIVNIRHGQGVYRQRWWVEAAIGRLKDLRRVATRYDKLTRHFGASWRSQQSTCSSGKSLTTESPGILSRCEGIWDFSSPRRIVRDWQRSSPTATARRSTSGGRRWCS